jgi:hypothetical protein
MPILRPSALEDDRSTGLGFVPSLAVVTYKSLHFNHVAVTLEFGGTMSRSLHCKGRQGHAYMLMSSSTIRSHAS